MDVEGAPVLKHFPCDCSIRLMGKVNQNLNGTYNQLSSDDEDSLNLLRQNGIMGDWTPVIEGIASPLLVIEPSYNLQRLPSKTYGVR
jgi:hypothetical protein